MQVRFQRQAIGDFKFNLTLKKNKFINTINSVGLKYLKKIYQNISISKV